MPNTTSNIPYAVLEETKPNNATGFATNSVASSGTTATNPQSESALAPNVNLDSPPSYVSRHARLLAELANNSIAQSPGEPIIHAVDSTGQITRLLRSSQDGEDPNMAIANAINNEAACNFGRAKNSARGTTVGLGIGWIGKIACGASGSFIAGMGLLGCLLFTCCNPRQPEDILAGDVQRPNPRSP